MRHRLRLDKLEQLLDASRLSQNHWALKLGLSRGHWSDIVNGRHPFPSAKTRLRMIEVFGVGQRDLFDDEDDPNAGVTDFRFALGSRYELNGEVGQGGMGTVYLAHDRTLGRLVAIKVVSAEAVAGVGAEQLLQEVSHVSRLQHPNILPVYEAEVRAGQPYYVMPYVQEGSLAALLASRERLPVSETVPLVQCMVRGLSYAHARQVLHCDIKPHNILVQDGHAYLMDFGIARKLHSEAQEWAGLRKELDFSAGTPAYVSPEQAAGDRAIDARSDVYSLACVVYEMLTGRAPFTGTTTQEVVSQRFRNPPTPLCDLAPDVPHSIANVVQRAMSIDPARRPQSAADFGSELARALQSDKATDRMNANAFPRKALSAIGRAGRKTFGVRVTLFPRRTMNGLSNEVRLVWRSLYRNWRFSLGVIASLGLAFGLGMPVLSVADHVFLRPPPGVGHPEQVVHLVTKSRARDGTINVDRGLTGLDVEMTSRHTQLLSGVAAWMSLGLSEGRGVDARPINAMLITPSFFPVLETHPALGRFFTAAEDVEGATVAPAVVSFRYWRSRLGGTANALGRTILIGSVSYEVVGVTPDGFNGTGLNAVDVWLPIHVAAPEFQGHDPQLWTTDRSSWLRIVARVKPGVTSEAASADANHAYYLSPPRIRDPKLQNPLQFEPLQPGRSLSPIKSARITLWLTGGAIALFLLVAANLVNLFLARNAANSRQIAIRLAIGGGRAQLLRLHIVEAALLGACSAALGLALSYPAVKVARELLMPGVVWVRPLLDFRIALLAFGIAAAIGALLGIWTTIQASRVDPATLLRSAGSAHMSGSRGALRLRQLLIVAQAAMLAILLSGSAAFVLSLRRASAVNVGFDVNAVMAATLPFSEATSTEVAKRAVYTRALQAVQALPDVTHAALAYTEPWLNNRFEDVSVPGKDIKAPLTLFDVTTPDYLATFGVQLREGRWITDADRIGTTPVIVINESLASAFFGTSPALGQCMRIGADSMPCRTIVGVARDFRMTGGVDGPSTAAYWLPLEQAQAFHWTPRIFFRARGDATSTVKSVRAALQSLQGDFSFINVHGVSNNIAWLTAPLKLGSTVFTAFGLLAAIIASLGLYSVLSFLVTEQRRAHAIRVALGASSWEVAQPVVRQSVLTVGTGLIIGVSAALLLGKVLNTLLFHTTIGDPWIVSAVAVLGLLVALGAAFTPVRRVVNTDAMEVLRDQ